MSGYNHQAHGEQNAQGCSSDDPLVTYRSSSEESTPLLPGRTRRKISPSSRRLILYGLIVLLVSAFPIINLYFHFTRCPLYPSTMDAIRRGWEEEKVQHILLQEEWRLEKQEHAVIEGEWKLQAEWHYRDVARRIQEENERQERVQQEWEQEYKRHVREVEEYEEAVARMVREEQERQETVRKWWDQEVARRIHEEEQRQESVRKDWDREVEEHHKEVTRETHEEEERRESVRREWAREVEEHGHQCEEMKRRENERRENERQKWRREMEDHDRVVEEREKREEEERQKLNMYWSQVEAHTCTTYATREYTAQLMNLPTTWEHRVEACKATPLEVHGISYLPKNCEDKGAGIVIGRWEINQHEPDCAPFWLWYKDKDCTSPGSGKRRIEHYLENLPKGGDWREFCATTPARFNGLEFSGAQECFQYNFGTYGHWEINDARCQ